MHIPDGFLDLKTSAAGAALGVAGLGFALRELRRHLPPARVPLLGLSTAFVFAAQMLNFPVGAGTSGHLLGAVLVTVLLGPAAAVLVMWAVLILQCLVFADGGLTALGTNAFNMAVLAPTVGHLVNRAVLRVGGGSLRSRIFAAAFASWCSVVAAAVACAGELAFSGAAPWRAAFPAMGLVHMVIGAGEATITALVLVAIARAQPDLVENPGLESTVPGGQRAFLAQGLVVAVGLVVFVAPFASPWPDGLEKAASMLGIEARAHGTPAVAAPLPDYTVPGLDFAQGATIVSGLVGVVLAFLLAWVLARVLTRGPGRPATPRP